MRLAALLPATGQHSAAWRHPEGRPDTCVDVAVYRELVQIAERGKFDFAFIADTFGPPPYSTESICRTAFQTLGFEPMTLMANLAGATRNLGFVVTASTSYWPPYLVARLMASLDLVSGGRAGWNVVTSTGESEARLFGPDELIAHDERYVRATEHVELVQRLWESSEPNVYLGDKASGLLFDPARVHRLDFDGRYYQIQGVFDVPPSPQGRPVLVQAGASDAGRQLAASIADATFISTPNIEVAFEYSADMQARMEKAGRQRIDAVFMAGLVPVIGRTEEEAYEKRAELDALLHGDLAISLLSLFYDEDLSGHDLDGPFPTEPGSGKGSQSVPQALRTMAAAEGLTVREVAARVGAGLTHKIVLGTATQIADTMQEWFERGACDGFLVAPLLTPPHLTEFVELVVPELQRRGLVREEYTSSTLRSNLQAN
jgi:FMN-dependent oxidoreductase (nitrilotriacetate monooxygenase family)